MVCFRGSSRKNIIIWIKGFMVFAFRDVDLPMKRELRSSLQVIKGVGFRKSFYIAAKCGIAYPFFIENLNVYQFAVISYLLRFFVRGESQVKRELNVFIRNLVELQTYKGLRHRDYLPVRGQRTRTNAGVRKRLASKKP